MLHPPDPIADDHRETLKDRRILVALTGSIACYKACGIASTLVHRGAVVRTIMTRGATRFVAPLTLEALTGSPVSVEMFAEGGTESATRHPHIDLARFAEVIGVIPATANLIGKLAGGIADDLLSTTLLSTRAPILIAPAMNPHLYQNAIVQENLKKLTEFGHHVVEPEEGSLSCGEFGKGRLPAEEDLIHEIVYLLRKRSGLEGKRVLVSAGRTEEPFDPVRYLTNRSSGMMGYAIARAARRFGAEVTLVSGPTALRPPRGCRFLPVRTASEMAETVFGEALSADLLFMAAAVCDFTPASYSEAKIKRRDGCLPASMKATEDIVARVAMGRKGKLLTVAFAMETEHLVENSRRKLEEKGVDIIVGNNPLETGTGFGEDFIRAVIIDRDGTEDDLPILEKDILAERLMEYALKKTEGRR